VQPTDIELSFLKLTGESKHLADVFMLLLMKVFQLKNIFCYFFSDEKADN